jgi:succinate dehydrogenase / fumarate reductase cytochrome b subunit
VFFMQTLGFPASRRVVPSTNAHKTAAALSGAFMAGWLVLHVLGNLSAFGGPDRMDAYAAALRRFGPALWLVRTGLLAAAIVHVVATVSLAKRARAARPVRAVRRFSAGSLSSRLSIVVGPMLILFVAYHLLHMTFGVLHPAFEPGHVYANLVGGLSAPAVALVYVAASALVGVHLYRGLTSAGASLGALRAANARPRAVAVVAAVALASAFASIPVAIFAGVLR